MTKDSLITFLDACPDDYGYVAENGFMPPPDALLKLATEGVAVPDGQPTEDEKFGLAMDFLRSYGQEACRAPADPLANWDEFTKLSEMSKKARALRAWCRRSAMSDPARKAKYEEYCRDFNYGQGMSYGNAVRSASCGVCGSGADDYGAFMSKAIDQVGKAAQKRDVTSMVSDMLAMIGAMDEDDALGSAYMVRILKEKAKAVQTAIFLEGGAIARP